MKTAAQYAESWFWWGIAAVGIGAMSIHFGLFIMCVGVGCLCISQEYDEEVEDAKNYSKEEKP